jgi:hypothetical protein
MAAKMEPSQLVTAELVAAEMVAAEMVAAWTVRPARLSSLGADAAPRRLA